MIYYPVIHYLTSGGKLAISLIKLLKKKALWT